MSWGSRSSCERHLVSSEQWFVHLSHSTTTRSNFFRSPPIAADVRSRQTSSTSAKHFTAKHSKTSSNDIETHLNPIKFWILTHKVLEWVARQSLKTLECRQHSTVCRSMPLLPASHHEVTPAKNTLSHCTVQACVMLREWQGTHLRWERCSFPSLFTSLRFKGRLGTTVQVDVSKRDVSMIHRIADGCVAISHDAWHGCNERFATPIQRSVILVDKTLFFESLRRRTKLVNSYTYNRIFQMRQSINKLSFSWIYL